MQGVWLGDLMPGPRRMVWLWRVPLMRRLARGGSSVGHRPASPGPAPEALLQDKASRSGARARGLSSRLFQKVTAGSTLAFLQQPRLHCFVNRSPAFKTKPDSLETGRACVVSTPDPGSPTSSPPAGTPSPRGPGPGGSPVPSSPGLSCSSALAPSSAHACWHTCSALGVHQDRLLGRAAQLCPAFCPVPRVVCPLSPGKGPGSRWACGSHRRARLPEGLPKNS